MALLRDVEPARLGLPNYEVCNVQRHIVTSALEASHADYLEPGGNLFVLDSVPVIAHIHWSSDFIDFLEDFLILFIVGGYETCHSLMVHSWVHQASDLLSLWDNIEDFIMN